MLIIFIFFIMGLVVCLKKLVNLSMDIIFRIVIPLVLIFAVYYILTNYTFIGEYVPYYTVEQLINLVKSKI